MRSVVATPAPVMTAVLAGFIIIGVALPVLPLTATDGAATTSRGR